MADYAEEEVYLQSKSKIQDYEPVVGRSYIEELCMLGERLSKKVVQTINSTYVGGGVAEILSHMVPLFNQLGVDVRWNVIQGGPEFFDVTKKFHNAIHGKNEKVSSKDLSLFLEVSKRNMNEMNFFGDIIFIHDPQPVALIAKKNDIGRKWVWRCHIDMSNPNRRVWNFLKKSVLQYDATIFSSPNFAQQLSVPQFLVPPAIDPLSDKNKELSNDTVESVLNKYRLDYDKPMIAQISRFDYLKDPIGVIEAFERVKKNIDCQLVLAGGTASDDPESEQVLNEVRERAAGNPDIHILLLPPGSDIDVNALQRAATVVMQKSLKEGFALTVSEALWKRKPVIASAVGGIPLQVKHRFTGLLCRGIDGAVYALRQLLSNSEYAAWLGDNGREHVKHNFLITRELRDYLLIFLSLDSSEDVIYL
jgi:trehalose synthase